MLNPSGKVSSRGSAFSRSCALLGQFVKEKKGFGDLSYEIGSGSNNAVSHTTMNLFPVNDKNEEAPPSTKGESVSLFPQHVCTSLVPNLSDIESAPMTIFYAGQVIVFNDFPAHKAKEIMELASLATSQNPRTTAPFVAFDDNTNDNNSDHPMTKSVLDSTSLIPPRPNVVRTILNDLPVVRKASLQRFLGKRKDRIAAKAPYNMSKPGDVPTKSKPSESDSWLGLAAAAGPGLP